MHVWQRLTGHERPLPRGADNRAASLTTGTPATPAPSSHPHARYVSAKPHTIDAPARAHLSHGPNIPRFSAHLRWAIIRPHRHQRHHDPRLPSGFAPPYHMLARLCVRRLVGSLEGSATSSNAPPTPIIDAHGHMGTQEGGGEGGARSWAGFE